MSYSLYQSSVPGFIAMLTNVSNWLDKATAQKGEATLLEARLAPDMFALPRQIQIASDSAKGAGAKLTGTEAPAMPDTETSFAELKERCAKTIAYLKGIDPAAYDAGASREVVLNFPNGGGMRFDGTTYLAGFVVPNFYFHASMVYAILRAQGVKIGKFDYLAHMAPHAFPPPPAPAS
jgi:hypothetical protein